MPRSYIPEFKKKIIRLHEEEGRTYKSIAAEYGVSKAGISKWCSEFGKQYQSKALDNPDAPNEMELMKENLRLRKELEEAKKDGTLVYNPVRRIATPKIVPYQAQTYSASELNELFEALKGFSIEDVVRITAFYGLRRSEVCGLRWQDVDFEQNIIYIRHKVLETRVNGQRDIMQTNELKTESSRRAFALMPTIRELLLKRHQKMEENQRLWGRDYNHTYDNYMFTLADGSLLTPNRVSD